MKITNRSQTLFLALFEDYFLFFAFVDRDLFPLLLLVFVTAFTLSLVPFSLGTKPLGRFQTLTKSPIVQIALESLLFAPLHHLQQTLIAKQALSPTWTSLFLSES